MKSLCHKFYVWDENEFPLTNWNLSFRFFNLTFWQEWLNASICPVNFQTLLRCWTSWHHHWTLLTLTWHPPETPDTILAPFWHYLDTILTLCCDSILTPSWHLPDTLFWHCPDTFLTLYFDIVLTPSWHSVLTLSWHLTVTMLWHCPDKILTHLKSPLLRLNKCYIKWQLLAGNGCNSPVNIFYMLIRVFRIVEYLNTWSWDFRFTKQILMYIHNYLVWD